MGNQNSKNMLITLKIENLSLYPRTTEPVLIMGAINAKYLLLGSMTQSLSLKSIAIFFANKLSFDSNKNFDEHPLWADHGYETAKKIGTDLSFPAHHSKMSPLSQKFLASPPPELSKIVEGNTRPNFFISVTTIVMKLFQRVRPIYNFFRSKVDQQYLILTAITRQFNNTKTPMIVLSKTVSNPDRLALSSGNTHLSKSEQKNLLSYINPLVELLGIHTTHHLPQKHQPQSDLNIL